MKTIVTHLSPDLDAIASSWLIRRYVKGWEKAEYEFVPAGKTLNDRAPDEDPNIIHVDTGLGQFDHHQTEDRNMCATKKVFLHLINESLLNKRDEEALDRLVTYVTMDDNFGDVHLPDPTADIYDFLLHRLVDGFKVIEPNDRERCLVGYRLLDSALQVIKNKLSAEREIKKGLTLTTRWGKTLALETRNDDTMKLAQKMGYAMVIRKDSQDGYVRIKTLPDKNLDLTPLYDALRRADSKATWFLHVSKNMLLNGTLKNPESVATTLPLQRVVEIARKIE